MSFDNVCKLLSEKYLDRFATWILGYTPPSIEVLKTELSIEPIRADSVIFLGLQEQILHLEFQVKLDSNPPLPVRMLDYFIRLYRLYRLPITQVVVLLTPPTEGTPIETAFVAASTRHEYRVIPLWEQDPSLFLQDPALLPFASLAAASDPEQLLAQVAEQVGRIQSRQQQREVSAYTQLLAGLRFDKQVIRQLFRERTMRESVIYQEILQEGEQKGELREAKTLVMRLLTRRIGSIPSELEPQLQSLSLPQLEELGEALLDFNSLDDLHQWLQTR